MGPHVKLMSNPAVVVKIIVSLPPSWKSTIMYAVPIAKLWHELKCKSWISLCRCAFFEFSIWHARHYSFNRRIRKMCAMYIQLDCWSSGRTRKIYLARNQKGYDNSKTTVGKLLARRIQIWVVFFIKAWFWKLYWIPFKIMPKQKKTSQIQVCLVKYSSSKGSDL